MIQGYGLTRTYTEKGTGLISDLDIYPLRSQTLPSVTRTVRYLYIGYLTLVGIYLFLSTVVEV